jgi:methionyl aminopeptidase
MDEQILEKYRKAGQIAAKARDEGVKKIKSDVSFLKVVNFIESYIRENGAKPAFPVNVSINNVAAHFTPRDDDKSIFKSGDLVKIDVGAQIDGYIADTAITVEIETNKYESLIKASEEALNDAIKAMKPDISLGKIGSIIQDKITSYNFKPIENLTGHSMNQYSLHSGLSVPNVKTKSHERKPKIGDVIAIEPFATTGYGRVVSNSGSNIYMISKGLRIRGFRDNRTKMHIKKLKQLFNTLPFSQKWCNVFIGNFDIVLHRLSNNGLLHHYPQLIEQNNGMVSQKEHTVIITKDGCEVTT